MISGVLTAMVSSPPVNTALIPLKGVAPRADSDRVCLLDTFWTWTERFPINKLDRHSEYRLSNQTQTQPDHVRATSSIHNRCINNGKRQMTPTIIIVTIMILIASVPTSKRRESGRERFWLIEPSPPRTLYGKTGLYVTPKEKLIFNCEFRRKHCIN